MHSLKEPSSLSRRRPRRSQIWETTVGGLRAVHPFPTLVVVATAVVLVAIAHHGAVSAQLWIRIGFVVLLSQIAVGSLNDYVDRHRDAIAQPDKPIPAGLVPARLTLLLTLVSLAAFIPIAATFGPGPFVLSAVGTAAGLAYDLWLKPTPLSFSMYIVGFLSLISWIWLVSGHLTLGFITVYPAGAFLLVAAHLAQSLPDIEADCLVGNRGLATILGVRAAVSWMVSCSLVVPLAGVVVALVRGTFPAVILLVAGCSGPLTAWFLRRRLVLEPRTRMTLFRLMALSIGLSGLGCLLLLSSV